MKFLIQRVKEAAVDIEGRRVAESGKGLLVFVGVEKDDTEAQADRFFEKLLKLRIFEDENGKTNLNIKDARGDLIFVSQFTLLADCKGQNRPGFTAAGSPEDAKRIFEYIVERSKKEFSGKTGSGEFAADMAVSLINDGPFTIYLDNTQV